MRDGLLEPSDIAAARARIAGRVHRTPTWSSSVLSREHGLRLSFKAELFQKTGSFKVRGVLNRLLTLTDEERQRGFISMSAGNHAAALSWAATSLGLRATIVMPARAVPTKVEATRGYGGEPVLTERSLLEVCDELRRERGLTLVHPFDDPAILAGHASLGLELLEDVPDVEVVIVPVGGGGLIGGVATALKQAHPDLRVIGVEPFGADVMTRSLATGAPVRLARLDTVADGLAAPFTGEWPLRHVRAHVDEVVRVEDAAILEALMRILTRTKLVAEPAAAASYAAILAGAVKLPPGTRTVCVLSGGNLDPVVLAGRRHA
ncbi:MAG TPA: threonine/serine dehydratase [Candidatus Polarisedimenticolaceae bacterium]|nr:threonine/serine dehydratase [Candidatus Polarisedimenticolaceae bacterium]